MTARASFPLASLGRSPQALVPAGAVQPKADRHTPASELRVLVIEDEPSVRQVCAELASSLGFHVKTADSVAAARTLMQSGTSDVVLLDLHLPGGSGTELLAELRTSQPNAAVVVMTAHATVHSAVEQMRNGACNFLAKPFTLNQLIEVLEDAQEHRRRADASRMLRERLAAGTGVGALIGASAGMQKVFRLISKVAFTRHPVLILGEPGTGKETVGRTIHGNGPNAAAPFVAVDCSPLRPELLDQELFGVEADQNQPARRGVLVTTGHGTVLLDEVSSLPLAVQSRLFRAIEDKLVSPVGGTSRVPFHSRILTASSRNLEAMVATGQFRKDLYYRLNVVKIDVPPLRDRSLDVLMLADHFLRREVREHGIEFIFSDEVSHFLKEYPWPGNLRELESAIERACALSSSPLIHLGDLGTQVQAYASATHDPCAANAVSVELPTMQDVERNTIVGTLEKLNGDKLLAARVLGIGKTTLYRKLKEYGIGDDFP